MASNNCDGSDSCSCKDQTEIGKHDIFDTFLAYTENESAQIELLKQEAVWGMNYILHHSLVKPIMDSAAETHHPLDTIENVTEDLTISFHDMSLQEVEGIYGEERDLEISVSAMSLGEEYMLQNNWQMTEVNLLTSVTMMMMMLTVSQTQIPQMVGLNPAFTLILIYKTMKAYFQVARWTCWNWTLQEISQKYSQK